jgi:hypothetical protein
MHSTNQAEPDQPPPERQQRQQRESNGGTFTSNRLFIENLHYEVSERELQVCCNRSFMRQRRLDDARATMAKERGRWRVHGDYFERKVGARTCSTCDLRAATQMDTQDERGRLSESECHAGRKVRMEMPKHNRRKGETLTPCFAPSKTAPFPTNRSHITGTVDKSTLKLLARSFICQKRSRLRPRWISNDLNLALTLFTLSPFFHPSYRSCRFDVSSSIRQDDLEEWLRSLTRKKLTLSPLKTLSTVH